ncbi:MAG: hypothetical protein MZW92_20955 [Comamonadaceae bacterium]|nr:hypothetical protein [Comamonadaceae bacterium]
MHALTDVTGFGAGRPRAGDGARRGLRRRTSTGPRVPLLPGVRELAGAGLRHRRLGAQLGRLRRRGRAAGRLRRRGPARLLTDPQTSGGLLAAVRAGRAGRGAGGLPPRTASATPRSSAASRRSRRRSAPVVG